MSADRFRILAEKRVNRCLKQMHLIGNLSNKTNYLYTPAHAQKIIESLEDGLAELKQRYANANKVKKIFELKL